MAPPGLAGFDREDDLLGLAAWLVVEVDAAVDALVRALLLVGRSSADQPERPPLELVGVRAGQLGRVLGTHGFADHFEAHGITESVLEPALDEGGGKVSHVYADPPT